MISVIDRKKANKKAARKTKPKPPAVAPQTGDASIDVVARPLVKIADAQPCERDPAERDWIEELCVLSSWASKRLPRIHPTRRAMERVLEDYDFDQLAEDSKISREAVEAFYRDTPPEDQRKVLAGWRALPVRPTLQELLDLTSKDGAVEHVVEVADCYGPKAFHSWREITCRVPVQVVIQAGTTREEVIGTLNKLLAYIDDKFEEFLESEPEWP